MDDTSGKSCWSVTAWTVGAFSILLVFGLLFDDTGGRETFAMKQETAIR